MIEIEINKEGLKYFGFTGLHLYSVVAAERDGGKYIELNRECEAIDLYKLYNDLAIFLSNSIDPSPYKRNFKTYGIYGNPDHLDKLLYREPNPPDFQIVGYLDKRDVIDFARFLNNNSLDETAGVERYLQELNAEVKEELSMLLNDRIVTELQVYCNSLVEFFDNCITLKLEVVIIANP